MYQNKLAAALAAIAIFITVLAMVTFHGRSGRTVAPECITVSIDTPEKAFAVWQEKHVAGRILLLFDNYPHAQGLMSYLKQGGAPQLTSSNFVEYSIFKNIIRQVYYVVPDSSWAEVRLQKELRPLRDVPGLAQGRFLFAKSGIPLIVTTVSALPHLDEKALVYINDGLFNPAQTMQILSRKSISSDITIFYQGRK